MLNGKMFMTRASLLGPALVGVLGLVHCGGVGEGPEPAEEARAVSQPGDDEVKPPAAPVLRLVTAPPRDALSAARPDGRFFPVTTRDELAQCERSVAGLQRNGRLSCSGPSSSLTVIRRTLPGPVDPTR